MGRLKEELSCWGVEWESALEAGFKGTLSKMLDRISWKPPPIWDIQFHEVPAPGLLSPLEDAFCCLWTETSLLRCPHKIPHHPPLRDMPHGWPTAPPAGIGGELGSLGGRCAPGCWVIEVLGQNCSRTVSSTVTSIRFESFNLNVSTLLFEENPSGMPGWLNG